MREFNSNSVEDTKKLALEFFQGLSSKEIVLLKGEVGSGKTTFVKEFVRNLSSDVPASSPSFKLLNIYKTKPYIYHFDFYRLKDKKELIDIGFWDYLAIEEGIIFIEWPEIIEEELKDRNIWSIEFEIKGENERTIKIFKNES